MTDEHSGEIEKSLSFEYILSGIKARFRGTLPKDVYTPYISLRLRFVPTPECPETNINGQIWRDGDENTIDYLTAIQLLEKKFPNNFKQASKPIKAMDGIGRLNSNAKPISVEDFQQIHIKICEIWLELDTVGRSIYSGTIPYISHAHCDYGPEQGLIVGRFATYKDLEHLYKAIKYGIQVANDLFKLIEIRRSSNLASIVSSNQRESNEPAELDDIPNSFERTKTGYAIRFSGSEPCNLGKLSGLFYIGEILRESPKSISVKDLLERRIGKLPEIASSGIIAEKERTVNMQTIRERLKTLQINRAHAEEISDEISLEKINLECENLELEYKRLKGFKGRIKRDVDILEKHRSSVSRAITYAYKQLEPHLPELVKHLQRYLSVGRYLEYKGDFQWRL